MLNLILNENMKIYNRLRTWVLIGIIIILTIILPLLISTVNDTKTDWRQQVQNQVEMHRSLLESDNKIIAPI